MKITLNDPVILGSQPPVTELVFRERICAGDLRGVKLAALNEMLTDDLLKIAGRLCAQPDPVMNALGLADLAQVIGVIERFFGPKS